MQQDQKRSLLCPNCRKLVSADEAVCPHCGMIRPGGRWQRAAAAMASLLNDNIVTTVIGANVAIFVFSIILYPRLRPMWGNPFALLAPSDRSLLLLGATGTIPIDRLGRWWTLVSASYLHGGILHLLFNMVALRQLAPLAVREYGPARFFAIYTFGGVAGYLLSYLAGVRFTIGASAAICAVIGAVLFYGWSRGGTFGGAILRQTIGWVVGLFLFGVVVPGINNWAHAGGLGAGLGLGALLGYADHRRENISHRALAAICLLLTMASLGIGILSALRYRFFG